MREAIIRFRFDQQESAQLAYEMMQELSYQPVMESSDHVFHIHLNRQDLTSALEIAAAYGGTLVEDSGERETKLIDDAYGMDMISIPAHLVNEDWATDDRYARTALSFDDLSHREEEARGWNDEEKTNHFSGGIHL